MSQTTWTGPLASGTFNAGIVGGPNIGFAELVQSATLAFDGTLVQNLTFNLPVGSQITNIVCDVTTAYNSATSATLTAGTSTGDTSYVSGVSAKTAGRAVVTYTAAQLLAMSNIGSNPAVVVTVTSVGQPTAGSVVVTVHYVQKAGN